MTSHSVKDEQLRAAISSVFNKYDKDKSNSLDFEEIRELLNDAYSQIGQTKSITDADVKKFSSAVDKNSDGKISKDELFEIFKRIVQSKK
jgi:Ca2+-binding EF-hand superfamily protein